MSAGHTPGPWHVGNGYVFADGDESSDFDDRVICAVGRAGMRSHEYAVIKAHKPEGRANAHLIAAAPDMYVLLERLADDYPPSSIGREWIDAALAKARGQ